MRSYWTFMDIVLLQIFICSLIHFSHVSNSLYRRITPRVPLPPQSAIGCLVCHTTHPWLWSSVIVLSFTGWEIRHYCMPRTRSVYLYTDLNHANCDKNSVSCKSSLISSNEAFRLVYSIYLSIYLYIYLSIYSCCSHLKHRAYVKRFVLLQFLNFRR
jgi:hypothetical protein